MDQFAEHQAKHQAETQPAYQAIAQTLRHNLQTGVYLPGAKLPSETALAQRFGVNRHTLRRAIALLQTEGLIRSEQGRGIFVSQTKIRYPIGQRVRYNAALQTQQRVARTEILQSIECPAEATIAQELEIAIGQPIIHIERLGYADNLPISAASLYFPATEFPQLLQHLSHYQSISLLLREVYGRDHLRRVTRVSARQVRSRDAKLLELPLNQPILLVESVNVDQRGQVIQYGITRFRGDQMELEFISPPIEPSAAEPSAAEQSSIDIASMGTPGNAHDSNQPVA
jgi:GntR family phosphonate transport system transcriptional regulator